MSPNGEAHGSGAGAGSAGGPEDFDDDAPTGKAGNVMPGDADRPSEGGDAPSGGST